MLPLLLHVLIFVVFKSILWFTESKILEKSRNKSAESSLLSIDEEIWITICIMAKLVE